MLGAIAGDIAGSTHEWHRVETRDFALFTRDSHFTDDSVLTVATAHAILTDGDFAAAYHAFGNRHPHAGYGGTFRSWLRSPSRQPYNSWGNGSALQLDVSCQGSVPEAIVAFLEAPDVEHAIRNAIFLGGDADTQAAIAGSLAEAWHGGVPAHVRDVALTRLSDDLREVTDRFAARYMRATTGDPS